VTDRQTRFEFTRSRFARLGGGPAAGLGWRRVLLIRRVASALLVAAAVFLAVRPPDGGSGERAVLVAARDLAPGSTLRPADVRVRHWPAALVPAHAFDSVEQASGKVLAGAASGGEPLTAPRFAGPELARQAGGRRDSVSVPIRLADADVAALLGPGRLVDVITVNPRSEQPSVLATGAVVLTILPADSKAAGGKGRLVLVAVPGPVATRLAAATLSQEVTVTLR
jgi:Flp pilus assembly protein CpaB